MLTALKHFGWFDFVPACVGAFGGWVTLLVLNPDDNWAIAYALIPLSMMVSILLQLSVVIAAAVYGWNEGVWQLQMLVGARRGRRVFGFSLLAPGVLLPMVRDFPVATALSVVALVFRAIVVATRSARAEAGCVGISVRD